MIFSLHQLMLSSDCQLGSNIKVVSLQSRLLVLDLRCHHLSTITIGRSFNSHEMVPLCPRNTFEMSNDINPETSLILGQSLEIHNLHLRELSIDFTSSRTQTKIVHWCIQWSTKRPLSLSRFMSHKVYPTDCMRIVLTRLSYQFSVIFRMAISRWILMRIVMKNSNLSLKSLIRKLFMIIRSKPASCGMMSVHDILRPNVIRRRITERMLIVGKPLSRFCAYNPSIKLTHLKVCIITRSIDHPQAFMGPHSSNMITFFYITICYTAYVLTINMRANDETLFIIMLTDITNPKGSSYHPGVAVIVRQVPLFIKLGGVQISIVSIYSIVTHAGGTGRYCISSIHQIEM